MATRRKTRRRRVSGTKAGARRITARRAYKPVRRRRRTSGVGAMGFDMEKIIGLMAGGLAAKAFTNFLPAGTTQTIVGAAQIGAGVILPTLMKGKGKKFVGHVGDGMLVAGTTTLAAEFAPGLVNGIGNYTIDTATLSGDKLPLLAGTQSQIEAQSQRDGIPIIAGIGGLEGLAELAGEI